MGFANQREDDLAFSGEVFGSAGIGDAVDELLGTAHRAGGTQLKIRHKVSGHLRRLPPGHRGSKTARSNAPSHVRQNMTDVETYVEPHFRGAEAEKSDLVTRLSRNSGLGDALADLELV